MEDYCVSGFMHKTLVIITATATCTTRVSTPLLSRRVVSSASARSRRSARGDLCVTQKHQRLRVRGDLAPLRGSEATGLITLARRKACVRKPGHGQRPMWAARMIGQEP
jgi:hypothetical protein